MTLIILRKTILKSQIRNTLRCLSRFNSSQSGASINDQNKLNTTKKENYYDIVICGGGMVGTSMAYALGN